MNRVSQPLHRIALNLPSVSLRVVARSSLLLASDLGKPWDSTGPVKEKTEPPEQNVNYGQHRPRCSHCPVVQSSQWPWMLSSGSQSAFSSALNSEASTQRKSTWVGRLRVWPLGGRQVNEPPGSTLPLAGPRLYWPRRRPMWFWSTFASHRKQLFLCSRTFP